MSRRVRRRVSSSAVGILLLGILLLIRFFWGAQTVPTPEVLAEGEYSLKRVVDGDTLLLTDGARVRLQGVDCPESVKPDWPVEPWGPEASKFTRTFTAAGKVRLQFDLERKDKFDRFLAYVWVGEKMLNEELLRAGLARAKTHYRYAESMKRRFRQAEQQAKDANLGIWSSDSAGKDALEK